MRRGTKRSRTSVANRKPLAAADEPFHHSVYVILLDSSVLRHPSILRLNPNREPTKPCVYVGMTGLSVERSSAVSSSKQIFGFCSRAGFKFALSHRCFFPVLFV